MSIAAFISSIFLIHLLGRWFSRGLRLDLDDDPIHSFLITNALGMILLSGIAFFLLAAGVGYQLLFAGIVYIGGLAGFIRTRKQFFNAFREINRVVFDAKKPLRRLFGYLIVFFLLLTFYMALAPSTAWDGLTYHYPLPAQWIDANSFKIIPEIIYSNFPSSAELIFIYGFAAYSDITANLLTWYAGFLCILFLFHFGSRHLSPEAGLGAGIILLSYPVVFIEELQGGYIDLIQAFYILALLDMLSNWAEKGDHKHILLAALFSGFTLCIKHSGLLTFAFAFLYIPYIGINKLMPHKRVLSAMLLFVLITWLLPLGWYIKSYAYTGNPVYPFLYHNFGGTFSSAPDIMYWANPNIEIGPVTTILYPILATFDVSMVQLPFRLLPPSILALIPFLFLRLRRSTFTGMTIAYVIYFILLISILEPGEPRYNLGAWALLGMLGLDSAFRFSAKAKWFGRVVIPLLIIIPLAVGSVDISRRYLNSRHEVIWGGQSKVEDSSGNNKYKRLDCYPIINEINKLTAENNGRVLLAEPRVFALDSHVDYIIAYPFQTENLWDWDSVKPVDIPGLLREYGIKYIAITHGPNYRGNCEAWFITQNRTEVGLDNTYAHQPRKIIGMGSAYFQTLASYANPHISIDDKQGWEPMLRYDGRFKDINELFESKGNIDVKLPAAINWCARKGYLEQILLDPAGVVYEVVN